jgi:hypothetical protein
MSFPKNLCCKTHCHDSESIYLEISGLDFMVTMSPSPLPVASYCRTDPLCRDLLVGLLKILEFADLGWLGDSGPLSSIKVINLGFNYGFYLGRCSVSYKRT